MAGRPAADTFASLRNGGRRAHSGTPADGYPAETMLPRCPFTRAGRDVSQCAGYEILEVDLSHQGSLGLAVSSWRTCRHLGAERKEWGLGYYPACHHPDGVPGQEESLSQAAG